MVDFMNKFKLGDKVICIKKTNELANMQPKDTGTVFEVNTYFKKYEVKIDNKSRGNDTCFMRECEIDFKDAAKRKIYMREIPVGYQTTKTKKKATELIISNFKLPPFKNPKAKRLKLIKARTKIFKQRELITQEKTDENLSSSIPYNLPIRFDDH